MWKVITRSDNEAFGVAAKGLNFSCGPTVGVGRLVLKMLFPFLPKEVLPFNVKVGRKLPSVKPTIHLGDGVIQKVTFLRPNNFQKIGFRKEQPGKKVRSEPNDVVGIRMAMKIRSDPVAAALR